MFKHILLATDGSPASAHAAGKAVELARAHGARLTALYVVDPYPYLGIGEANPLGFQAYMGAAQAHATQALTQVLDVAAQGEPKLPVETRIAEEVAAARGIVKVASDEGADLIVVGSHGRTGIQKLVLGSVAAKVVAESHLPVLVVR